MVELNQEYWSNRYQENKTGWDIESANPYLIKQLSRFPKSAKILIPGAGNAHEAEALWNLGYKNVFVLDWAKEPLDSLKSRVSDFPENQLIQGDFFTHQGVYDVILEQTFFCALDPELREKYAYHMSGLLAENGVLLGLLFTFNKPDGPPFGGSEEEYRTLFSKNFTLQTLEPCQESIPPRQGNEVYFELIGK